MSNLGVLFKSRRKELGLTQEELSHGICSITYISKVENNYIEPKDEILDLLLLRLHLNHSDLDKYNDQKIIDYLDMVSVKNIKGELTKKDTDNAVEIFSFNVNPTIRAKAAILLINVLTKHAEPNKIAPYLNYIKKNFDLFPDEIKYSYLIAYGSYCNTVNSLIKARTLYEMAIEYKQGSSDPDLFYKLGLVYSKLELFSHSNKYLEQALSSYNLSLNFKRIIECNMVIGINFSKEGHFEKAKDVFLKLLNNRNIYISNNYSSRIFHNLAIAYLYLDDTETALRYFNNSIDLKQNKEDNTSSYYFLAYIHNQNGNKQMMMDYINLGLKHSTQNLVMHYKFEIMKLYSLKKYEELISSLESKMLDYFKDNNPIMYKESLLLAAELYKKFNRYKKSTYYLETYINLDNKTLRKEILL